MSNRTSTPTSSIETQITFRDRPTLPGAWVHPRAPWRGGLTSNTSSPRNFGYNFGQNLRGHPIPRVPTTIEMATNDTTDQGDAQQGANLGGKPRGSN